MAQYFIDPTNFDAASWTIRTGGTHDQGHIIRLATDPLIGSPVISYNSDSSTLDGTMSYDPAGNSSADVEIITYGRIDSILSNNKLGLAARILAGAFYFGMKYASNSVYLGKSVSNSRTFFGNTPAQLVTSYSYLRFRVNGTTIKIKNWSGSIDAEPETWNIEVTDSSILDAGYIGLYSRTVYPNFYQFIGIGTNGDPAPTEPIAPPTLKPPTNLRVVSIGPTSTRLEWDAPA